MRGPRVGVDGADPARERRGYVLGKDLRLETQGPEPPLDVEHLIGDGVAFGCTRVELVDCL